MKCIKIEKKNIMHLRCVTVRSRKTCLCRGAGDGHPTVVGLFPAEGSALVALFEEFYIIYDVRSILLLYLCVWCVSVVVFLLRLEVRKRCLTCS